MYTEPNDSHQDPGPLPAYLNVRPRELAGEPRVWLHRGVTVTVAVVVLDEDGLDVHLSTAAQARGLAQAFTKAAEMLDLDAAEAAADDDTALS